MWLLFAAVLLQTRVSPGQQLTIRSGMNISEIGNLSRYPGSTIIQPVTGLHAGIFREFSTEKRTFEAGVLLTAKGAKYQGSRPGLSYESNVNLWYAEVPLTIKNHFSIEHVRMSFNYGTYVAFGMFGRKTGYMIRNDETNWFNTSAWRNSSPFSRLDAGLTAGLNAEFQNLQVGMFYDLGVLGMYPSMTHWEFNKSFSISVGYKLRKR